MTCGQIIVADCDNHRVQVFDLDGVFLRQWGSRGSEHGQFECPWGVAVRGNEVLVSDSSNHRVQRFGLDGTFVSAWGSEGAGDCQVSYPTGLSVTRAGHVLVGDTNNARVVEFA